MYSILLVCSLVSLCFAAERPVIPGTFNATTSVEIHRGKMAEFGKGIFCSDGTGERTVRNESIEATPGEPRRGYFFQLELFKEHTEYHIRPDDGREECSHETVRGEFREPFAWVADAKYNGSETVEHRTLDVWYTRVGTTELAVGVEADTPNVPVVFMERGVGEERIVTFEKFTPGTPSSTVFEIPRQCRERT